MKGFYSVIQFVPDLDRGEGANVGVVMAVPQTQYLEVLLSDDNAAPLRLFGQDVLDLDRLNLAKASLRDRLLEDGAGWRTSDDLAHFSAKEGNHLVLLPPRTILTENPAADHERLLRGLVHLRPDSVCYYDTHGLHFSKDTLNVAMEELYGHFLPHVPPQGFILDAGCGSGRDAKAFLARKFRVAAFDGSKTMTQLASEQTGLRVRLCTFQAFDDVALYDGIWACASLLHVPRAELPQAMGNLLRAIRPAGVLYVSFKFGTGDRVSKGRHFTDFTPETLAGWLRQFQGVELVESWVTGDCRPDRGEEKWTNALLRTQSS